MILSLAELTKTTKNKIATFTGVNVTLGMPDDAEPGLFLFPYNLLVDPLIRDIPTREIESQTTTSYHVKCLLIPGQPIDYAALNKGFNYISNNPDLEFSGGTVRVTEENISTEELTSLFISAGVPHRLSIAFNMQYIAN